MEEAEALSTKMGIMVQGGIFTCFGSAQHIKDKFGSGFEVELKMNDITDKEVNGLIRKVGIGQNEKEKNLSAKYLIEFATKKGMLAKDMHTDFENCILKIIYSINSHLKNIDDIKVTPVEFVKLLNCYLSVHEIIKMFLKEFGRVEMLESHGRSYFKLRIPRK